MAEEQNQVPEAAPMHSDVRAHFSAMQLALVGSLGGLALIIGTVLGLVPPNDPGAMANAIDSMMDDPERAKKMGEDGQAHYMETFVPERHIGKLMDLFQTLTERSSAHA